MEFVRNGGLEIRHAAATPYSSIDLRALVYLESAASELEITEPEGRTSRDIELAQQHLIRESSSRILNRGRAGVAAKT